MTRNTEEILILAPTGRDAQLIAGSIAEENVRVRTVRDIEELCQGLRDRQAAALIIAEEGLTHPGLALLNEALEAQEPWSDVPIILMTAGGETTLAILRIKKAFSPSGNVTLLERPFRRITLQSVVQVALRARRKQHEMKDLLEQQLAATRLRDEFISIASHELKTPLTSLKLQTQLNQRKLRNSDSAPLSPEYASKLVDSTARQVDRLAKLVEDMLDISRINTGKLFLNLETFDLAELVKETTERILPQLEAAGCQVTVHADQAVSGSWDRYRIEQVLTNLLTNTIRYAPGKPVHLRLECTDQTVTVTVRDEGSGIDPESHERIFQRFERAVTANNISGLGIGLYICRKIIEAHEGTIRVESAPGRGSTFIVSLPIRVAARQAAADLTSAV